MLRPIADLPAMTSPGPWRGLVVAVSSATLLLASACSGSSDSVDAAQRRVAQAEEALAEANAALEGAGAAFCAQAKDYILAIDRYGKIFDEQAATVGDLRTLGADLGEPRESTVAAAQAVLDAHDAVNEANLALAEARAALKAAKASASGKPGDTGVDEQPFSLVLAGGVHRVGRTGADR